MLLLLFCVVSYAQTISGKDGRGQCPKVCLCLESFVDCSDKDLKELPSDLPTWTKSLDLSNNSLKKESVLNINNYPLLEELKFDKNIFREIPIITSLKKLLTLSISSNKIGNIILEFWDGVPNLKFLDMSYNEIQILDYGMFPKSSQLTSLNFNNNKISHIEKGCLDGLKQLSELKLSRNHLNDLNKDLFKHVNNLKTLELNHNRFKKIEGLTFKDLEKLLVLKIRQNSVSSLEDGAFWGLHSLKTLKLDQNKIKRVSKGWTYGLTSVEELYLGMNIIHDIAEDAWEYCRRLQTLDLSNNDLNALQLSSFKHLTNLRKLKLSYNMISKIQEGTFNSTPSLKILDLSNNKISWIIEDMSGAFIGLKELTKLSLSANQITSINQKAFIGLRSLKELDLNHNSIKTIQDSSFNNMPLETLSINTSSLICDCTLSWFSMWLSNTPISLNIAVCAYPESFKGKHFQSIPREELFCSDNESPKPVITVEPQSTTAVTGSKINISCSGASSNSTLNFKWKRNNEDVPYKSIITMNSTAILQFQNVKLSHGGEYQCIVFNDFGKAYSQKATLKVLVLPVMIKKPGNITVKAGSTAKLECAATGEPTPQVGWQKDGGTEFPAAQERRMHVMPTDDVFFIVNAKPIDSGLYSCIARNSAGTVMANGSLTVLAAPTLSKKMEDKEVKVGMSAVFECLGNGLPKPKIRWWKDGTVLALTHRHYMTTDNEVLVITDVKDVDAGSYQCELFNNMGAENSTARLSIRPAYSASCEDITGVVIISVVCCAVGTSVIWVFIIYQTRKQFQNYGIPKDSTNKLDTKSELSASSKDSGTGESTRRSHEELQLDTFKNSEKNHIDGIETIAEISAPLLSNNCYCVRTQKQQDVCCSASLRECTRSNHDRCKNKRPISTPSTSTRTLSNNHQSSSYLCLYSSPPRTAL